jgi:Effector Associated Constant Component 1
MSEMVELKFIAIPENFDHKSPEAAKIFRNLREALETDKEVSLSLPKSDAVVKDAKGEPITIGALVIAVASAPAVIRLAKALNTWIRTLGKRKVKITIQTRERKITADARGFSKSDVEELVNAVSEAFSKSR